MCAAAPLSVHAVYVTGGAIALAYSVPLDHGGGGIVRYVLRAKNGGATVSGTSTAMNGTITGLAANTNYE